MNKRGFTLVELLAVIVVLGVIAIIIVPRIINTIENSKEDSAIVSAKGYMDSITKYYVEKNTANYDNLGDKSYGIEISGIYSIENGVLKKDSESISIPFTGAPPKSGKVFIKNGEVISGCLTIGKFSVVINESNIIRSVEGDCNTVATDYPSEVRSDEYRYFNDPIVVYYNPETDELCDAGSSSSSNGDVTGCMKWYAYSFNGNVVNMILNHNINQYNASSDSFYDVVAISSDDYSNGTALAAELGVSNIGNGSYGDYGNFDKGPLTALKFLKERTSNWNSHVSGSYSTYTANSGDAQYTVNYSGYKARLITAEEVVYTKNSSFGNGIVGGLDFCFRENLVAPESGINFFWTVTPNINSVGFYSVGPSNDSQASISHTFLNAQSYNGVRPVVSIDYDRVKLFIK